MMRARTHKISRSIESLRQMQKSMAEEDASSAAREVRDRAAAKEAADAAQIKALTDWSDYLGDGLILPEQMQRLAYQLSETEILAGQASTNLSDAERQETLRRFALLKADAALKTAKKNSARVQRQIAQDRDEAAQAASEERFAFRWSQS